MEFPGERRSAGVRPAGARSLVAGAYLWAIVFFVLTAGVYLVDWLIHRGLSVAYGGYLSRRFDGVQSLGDAILVLLLAGFTVKRLGKMGADAQTIRRGDLVFAPLTCALAVILFIAAVLVTFGLVARRGPVME